MVRKRTTIIAHDITDKSTNNNITACTTRPAPLTRLQMDMESACITATPLRAPLLVGAATLGVLSYQPARRLRLFGRGKVAHHHAILAVQTQYGLFLSKRALSRSLHHP